MSIYVHFPELPESILGIVVGMGPGETPMIGIKDTYGQITEWHGKPGVLPTKEELIDLAIRHVRQSMSNTRRN